MPNELGCIAVVDDDLIMGESLQRALELEGWRVVWWHNGKQAVNEMCALCPDLVLCDIRLPDMSGEEVFRAANVRSLAAPFIFMTAYGQIDQAVALVRAGAHDYLTKPFELASLFPKAREILSLRARDGAQGVLGVSPPMRRVEALFAQAGAAIAVDSPRRGNGRRQGSLRAVSSPGLAGRRRTVHGGQLRGDSSGTARKRSVRPRARRLLGRPPTSPRLRRTRPRRRPVSRRDRGDAAGAAIETAARARGEVVSPGRRRGQRSSEGPHRLRDERESRRPGSSRDVPRGPALSDQRRDRGSAAASRPSGGHSLARCPAILRYLPIRPKFRCAGSVRWPRKPLCHIRGAAMCASFATGSSGQ